MKTLILIWLGTVYGYVMLTHAKAVYGRQGLSWFWKVHLSRCFHRAFRETFEKRPGGDSGSLGGGPRNSTTSTSTSSCDVATF